MTRRGVGGTPHAELWGLRPLLPVSLGVNPTVCPCPRHVWRPLPSREQFPPRAGLLPSWPRGPSCSSVDTGPLVRGLRTPAPGDHPSLFGLGLPLLGGHRRPPPHCPHPLGGPDALGQDLAGAREKGWRVGGEAVQTVPSVGSCGGPGTGPRSGIGTQGTFQSAGVVAPTEGRAPALGARLPPIPRRGGSLSAGGTSCSENCLHGHCLGSGSPGVQH